MTDAEGNEIGKLFVGGLSQATNNGSLRLYFSRFGEVDDAVVMMDNKTGRSRGFGYVKYREPESVALALEAKPHILDGKEVDAKQCNVNMKGRNRRSLKIFVGGIGLDQDAESIKNYFKQFGRVTDVNLMMDSNKQRHRGFAFVGFEDETVVKRLISLHYVTMSNKQVEIKAMEPPNFGRKIGPTTCLTTTAVLASGPSVDGGCVNPFDNTSDPSGLLASGLNGLTATGAYGTHPHSYLSTQTPGLQCPQHNLLGQPRPTPNGYEHPGFGTGIVSESIFQPTAYIQSLSPTQHSARTPGEAILTANSTNNPYVSSKQSIPYILTSNHLHQTNQLTHGGLVSFSPNTSSLYTTFPCQLIPPQFVPQQSANGGIGQILNPEKATISGWQPTHVHPTHLTICQPQTGLISCSQYGSSVSTQPQQGSTVTGMQNNSVSSTTGSILTPYYAVCPQYTTIQLQNDHSNPVQYATGPTSQGATAILGAGLNTCGISSTQPGAGDSTLVQIPTHSNSSSPSSESKPDSYSALQNSMSTKVVYPTILMTTHTPTNTNVMQSPNGGMNVGQTMWNNTSSGMVYPTLPVGWTVQAPTQSNSSQPWQPSVALLSQQVPVATPAGSNALKLAESMGQGGMGNMQPAMPDQTCINKETNLDTTQVTSAKASGDSLDGLVSAAEHNVTYPTSDYRATDEMNTTSNYRCMKTTTDAIPVEGPRPASQNTDLNSWQMNASVQRSSGSSALPSWSNSLVSSTPITRWNEMHQANPNYNTSTNVVMHQQHPWNLPLELMDESIPNYGLATRGNEQPVTSSSRRGMTDLNLSMNGMHQNIACQHGTTSKHIAGSGKADHISSSLMPSGYQRSNQRLPQYQQQVIGSEQQSLNQSLPRSSGHSKLSTPLEDSEDPSSTMNGLANTGMTSSSRNCASVLSVEVNNTRGSSNRVDYSSWLYNSPSGNGRGMENTNGGDGKDIQTTNAVGVDIECQSPAGAAGDYHRPVHTGHFTNYHLTH